MNFRSAESVSVDDYDEFNSVEMTKVVTEEFDIHLGEFDKDLKEVIEMLEKAGVDCNKFRVTGFDEHTNTLSLKRETTYTFKKGYLEAEIGKQGSSWARNRYDELTFEKALDRYRRY